MWLYRMVHAATAASVRIADKHVYKAEDLTILVQDPLGKARKLALEVGQHLTDRYARSGDGKSAVGEGAKSGGDSHGRHVEKSIRDLPIPRSCYEPANIGSVTRLTNRCLNFTVVLVATGRNDGVEKR